MTIKRVMGLLVGLGLLAFVGSLKPWRKGAAKLENAEGVGPAHVTGVPRGEARAKGGPDGPSSVAGRIPGSIHPD